MRDIKFRYWCTFENKMYDKAYVEEHMKFAMMSELIEAAQKRYVFQQFTGLYDVNGREIYEGDILEYKKLSFNEDGYEKGSVVYNEYAEWAVNGWLLNRLNNKAKVVGNIYEGE